MKHKALLITNIPNPYRLPLFNELNRQLAKAGVELLVAFGALGYDRRKFRLDMNECEFPYRVLEKGTIEQRNSESVSFTYGGLNALIREFRPDVIIGNAFSMATVKLWLRSFLSSVPYLIWSGATSDAAGQRFLRGLQRRWLVSRASGFIAYGSAARDYLVSLGADFTDVEIGINTVDTDHFSTAIELRKPREGDTLRLLCISYLTRRKRVDQLLRALSIVKQSGRNFTLTILGEGQEQESLGQLAEQLGISSKVHFEGFVQKDRIPAFMAESDCFVFPTGFDIWGLTLVEAMAAGLPCVVSDKAGAARDLVKEGENGFVVDYGNENAVAGLICRVADDPDFARRMGEAAAAFIRDNVTVRDSARGFAAAIMRQLQSDR